jgi:hypothetical protein
MAVPPIPLANPAPSAGVGVTDCPDSSVAG